jgi:hypothetical protein
MRSRDSVQAACSAFSSEINLEVVLRNRLTRDTGEASQSELGGTDNPNRCAARAPVSALSRFNGVTQSLDQVSAIRVRIRLQVPSHIILKLNGSKTAPHTVMQYDRPTMRRKLPPK